MADSMVKGGYFYRRNKAGKMLRIRKQAPPKPKGVGAVVADPKRLAAWRGNPGLRSKLPESALTPEQRASRRLNTRLNAPVVPGSTITNRDAAHQTKSYITQKYGQGDVAEQQQIRGQQQRNTDIPVWYDQYLASLGQYNTQVGAINDTAVQQVGDFGKGLAQAQPQLIAGQSDPISNQINAQAQQVRDARAGSWVGQLAATGAANKTYASKLANVVGPLQKLAATKEGARALAVLMENKKARADTKGADAANFRAGIVSGEAKNQTALAIAQGKADVSTANNIRNNKTSRANTQDRTAASRAQWSSSLNKYGVTNGAWRDWGKTPAGKAKRAAAIKAYNDSKGGKGKTPKAKHLPAAGDSQITTVRSVVGYANTVKASKKPQTSRWGKSSELMYRYLKSQNRSGTPDLFLRMAAEVSVDGYVHQATAAAIRKQIGIRVRDFGYPVRGAKKTGAQGSPH